MKLQEAKQLIKQTFENPFDKNQYRYFINNLLKDAYEEKPFTQQGAHLPDAFSAYIRKLERIGKFEDEEGNIVDILVVELKKEHSVEWARTTQRNFIRRYLNGSRGGELKDAALVAFYTEGAEDWRFSLIKMQYSLEKKKDDLTPAKRFSFLVGKNEKSHTAQKQLTRLLTMDNVPVLAEIEQSFNIEIVTKEFFEKYKDLFLRLSEHIGKQLDRNKSLKKELEEKHIDHNSFTKKLLGQIVFLYFLQKKGWLGVPKNGKWGEGDKKFLRSLLTEAIANRQNFYTDYLQYLFYEALAEERRNAADPSYYKYLDCKIPFLNGGLFEADYDWKEITIKIPNDFFTNENNTKEGDTGNGILDVFDRYNFTVKEDEPLEKEVAVDPEMLGKVFENLLEVTDRKSKGAFYTPREIVHYMCQESLINYLDTTLNNDPVAYQKLGVAQTEMFGNKARKGQLPIEVEHGSKTKVPRKDIEAFIREGINSIEHDRAKEKGLLKTKEHGLPESVRSYATEIDNALADIRVCDPAIGSGAFPVGIMNEIVIAREILTAFLPANEQKDRTAYELKRHCIQESIYGVDIDHSAIDIAKLRLWLSLVVDEEDFYKIKPLPNLDYKIVEGNSLIGLPYEPKAIDKVEELKRQFFNETNIAEKQKLRKKINQEIEKVLQIGSNQLGQHIMFDYNLFFSEVFITKGGFDVIVANPPYVGQKGNKEMFQQIKATPFGQKYHQRRMDLFYFFFHLGINKLKPGGILSFITTNYFLTATYSDKLRQHLYDSATILSLFNFNELKVFESAQGQHNLITILRKEKREHIVAETAITERQGLASEDLLHSILSRKDEFTLYYNQLQESIFEKNTLYIRIQPAEVKTGEKNANLNIHSLLEQIRQQSQPFGTFVDISTGIQSSSDKVTPSFLKKYPSVDAEEGEGIYLLTNKEIQAKKFNQEDKKFIKKTYKNSEVRRWIFFPDNSLNVIYIKSDVKDLKLSDGIKKHLDRYKLILINRNIRAGCTSIKEYDDFVRGKKHLSYIMNASAMKKGNYYCLSYARNGTDTFEVPKIVNPRRAKSNVFAYESKGYYEQSDIVVSTLKKEFAGKIELKYLLAIINSKLIFKWLLHKGKRKGDMLELFQKPLSEIPIRVSKNQQSFVNKVNQIIEMKQNNAEANISNIERQIDIIVYHLYRLTFPEAKIIDPELSEEEFEKHALKENAYEHFSLS